MAALNDQEKERVRYHLGFPNVGSMASLAFGVPIPIDTLFVLEQAMTLLINAFAIDRIRSMLNTLDYIEAKMVRAIPHLAADSLGDLVLSGSGSGSNGMRETDFLEKEYARWSARLADQLGAPQYAYSLRNKAGRGRSGNIPVRST